MAPRGTLGSKTVSITLCTSKSRSNLRILAKEGRSCNRAYQTQSIFQRPLGPPAAPELISVIADTLGTAIITKKSPLEDGGARIRSYEVIEVGSSTPANKVLARITTSFPIKAQQSTKISGLTPSQSYRFAIRAINAIGASPLAQSSSVFVAPTLPGAPSITSAVASSFNSAQITYSPSLSDGGSPVTSYTITALPGRLQSTFLATDAKHHTFTGLSALTSYTFTIQATNIAGSGLASAPSNQITTFAPPPPPEPVAPTPSPSPSSSAPALAAPAFTLSSSSETRTVNTAATGFTISSTGGAIASFAISATPAGMSFSTSTGALTGTPTTVAGATAYTITATNASGSTTQTFTLTVSVAAPAFTLSSSSETRTVNTAATGFTISSTGGAIASFAISATPAGMSFSTSTGALTGTPTTVAGATAYTITATNASGSTTQTFTLTVSVAAPAFTLSSSSETRTVNTAATGFTISSTGGAIASYAISPAASAGLTFSTSTGQLSGTPTSAQSATTYTITATNATGSTTQTFTLTVSPGAATKAMMTTQPAGAVSGSAFTTQPVVRVTDSGGNTVTTSTAVVTVSKASGSGTLSGTTTATAVAGIATFTNLVITGTGDHVLTFTPDTLTAVNSETLTVSLAAQATLSITSLTTSTKAHSYSQALSITTSGGSGTGATTFAIASGGTATTCTLSNSTATATITATTVGTCLIQATKAADATYASTTSATATFTFQVGAATKAMMTTQPAGAVNGSAFTTQPVVRVTDSGDNTVTSFTSNVVASIASGTGTLSGTTTATAVAGVATFTNLVITGTAGNFTLTFTPASLTAVTSSSFALAAGAATKVAITRASVGTTDNVAFTTQPQITIQDASGNTVLSSAVVTATISADSLIGTDTATASSGVATFTGLGIDGTNGTTYTITYTVSGLTVATAAVTVALTCAAGGACIVGDTGPGGGIVFYVAASNFTSTGSTCNTTCRYLEAAPTSGTNAWTDATYAWSGNTTVRIGATAEGTAIGTGYANTLAIVGQASGGNTANRAATNARAYRGPNNLSDWFLPSKDELNQMCKWSRGITGVDLITLTTVCAGGATNTGLGAAGFVKDYYWSSSENDYSAASARIQFFGDFGTPGYQYIDSKWQTYYVRPVRTF